MRRSFVLLTWSQRNNEVPSLKVNKENSLEKLISTLQRLKPRKHVDVCDKENAK